MSESAPGQGPVTTDATLAQAIDLHARGELDAAAALYLNIIRAQPDNFDALHMLGVYAYQTGNLESAHKLLRQAIRISPGDARAHVHLSAVLQQQGSLQEALGVIQHALVLAPDLALALNNGATLLSKDLRRPADALPLLEHALRVDDQDAIAWNGLGYALIELRRHEEALLCLERALQLQPGFALAWYNQGNALLAQNRVDAAMASHDAALASDPALDDARFSQSVCRLLAGDLEQGFRLYESRWRKPAYQALAQQHTRPLWLGDSTLRDRTLLLHHEQGLGDTLHMVRYIPQLAAQGARIILRVQPPLLSLLAGMAGAEVIASDAAVPAHDLQTPLMSLPLALGTRLDTIPAQLPYLHADAALCTQWRQRLGPAHAPRIGLAWAGNPGHNNDSARSIPLQNMLALVRPGLELITLQRDLGAIHKLQLAQQPAVRSFADAQADFAQTAALVAQLDLVVCVDTAIAHLAGAMGKPVWLLLPYAPDWRWLLERQDSPWYPGMRLFRQRRPGDWDEVLARVAEALSRLAAGEQPGAPA